MRIPTPAEPRPLPVRGTPIELAPEELALAQRGDARALTTLIRTYESRLFAYLSRTTGRGPHVDDLAQETMLRALAALPQFVLRPPAKLSTWIFRIATNVVHDARKKHRLPLIDGAEEPASASPSPERELELRRLGERLEAAASELKSEFREAFVLHHFHGLSLEEISYATDASIPTVKTRIHRAKEKLRECLQEEVRSLP